MVRAPLPAESDPNTLACELAWQELRASPLFGPMIRGRLYPHSNVSLTLVAEPIPGIARVTMDGRITASRARRLDAEEWRWVLAHCLLHLGFDHLDPAVEHDAAFRAAACVAVTRFQRAVKLGREPDPLPQLLPVTEEAALAARWRREGVPDGFAGPPDLDPTPVRFRPGAEPSWPERFASGLSAAAMAGVPDIPRPGRRHPEELVRKHTFGVVVDTSGSMGRQLMGRALGAIASYATARDVPAARVVFCDAAAYDAGYLPVDGIAGRVRVRGRGGTRLQPAIDLLERADDFPREGPILVITDGECDVLRIRRPHAYLVPRGARLPFTPRGEVFSLR
ncbi:hypothetical protein [Actinoplanes flavus]|uniref:Metallopeptidase domain-containing protein n=1 Tax=Actinoplanes flavus TaxID=2820290 RepID=A0ABS3UE11_9ACTN|nr:hypothetical protein [Actinoplanes flavus]MBO3737022.1 hypothetical protein [Actinoplanes flavus]